VFSKGMQASSTIFEVFQSSSPESKQCDVNVFFSVKTVETIVLATVYDHHLEGDHPSLHRLLTIHSKFSASVSHWWILPNSGKMKDHNNRDKEFISNSVSV